MSVFKSDIKVWVFKREHHSAYGMFDFFSKAENTWPHCLSDSTLSAGQSYMRQTVWLCPVLKGVEGLLTDLKVGTEVGKPNYFWRVFWLLRVRCLDESENSCPVPSQGFRWMSIKILEVQKYEPRRHCMSDCFSRAM